jgi:hypothetical protein
MSEMIWKTEPGSRMRAAFALAIAADKSLISIVTKDPAAAPRFASMVAVKGSQPVSNGKWSHVIYRLVPHESVRLITGHMGFETGKLAEGLRAALRSGPLDTWAELAAALGVRREVAEEWVRRQAALWAAELDAADIAP